MYRIKALAVKGYGPFVKQTVFHFRPGVSVIYGLNKTSGKFSKNSNYVGKSLFFNALSEILYDEPIVGLKQDKMRSGAKSVILASPEHKLQITKKGDKRETITIVKDGQEIEHLTKTKAAEFIAQEWGVQKAEFETFIHLDSRVPHPLVMGSSTERKHFFDDFFKLDRVDFERKLYLAKLREIAESKAAYTELKRSYDVQKQTVLDEETVDQLSNEVTELKAKRTELNQKLQEAQEYQRLKVVAEVVEQKIEVLSDLLGHPAEIKDFPLYRKDYAEQIAKYTAMTRQAMRYSLYASKLSEYNTASENLSDLARNTDNEKLRKGADLYRSYYTELRSAQNELTRVERREPRAVLKPDAIEKADLSELQYQKRDLESHLASAVKFKSGVCPTCGQKVDLPNTDELKTQIAELKTRIDNAQKCQAYEAYQTQKMEWETAHTQAEEHVQELTQKAEKYEKYANAFDEVRNLPTKPEAVEKPECTSEEASEKRQTAQSIVDAIDSLKNFQDDYDKYLHWDGLKEFDYSRTTALNERIAKIEAKLELNKETAASLKSTVRRLKELKELLKDEPYLKILSEIFSDKLIKKAMVAQISAKLCALLNKYATLVFDTDYRFNLVWDTQLQLICTRKVGKQELVSDVRKLSGAESKLFTLILILSLMSFVPSAKRPKVMILDEPTANFSAETTQSFIKLLDILKTVVPSIVIITPRDDVYPDSMCYTVVRDKNGSFIAEGLPDELA